jgi:hypothetical protein
MNSAFTKDGQFNIEILAGVLKMERHEQII